MNKRGIQGSARTPCLYKNELDLNSEHLLMPNTAKFLQSPGNYHDSILTTTMSWKHTGQTGHELCTSICSDFFCVGMFIQGIFIISIVKSYQIPFNLTDMG